MTITSIPADRRARPASVTSPAHTVARALTIDPGDPATLEAWATRLHVSSKTLQRDFRKEFGAPYSEVRNLLRLRAATVLLDSMSVTEVADRVGYSSTSAFVQAFSRARGVTPGTIQRQNRNAA